jgi:hypothetical protein
MLVYRTAFRVITGNLNIYLKFNRFQMDCCMKRSDESQEQQSLMLPKVFIWVRLDNSQNRGLLSIIQNILVMNQANKFIYLEQMSASEE